MTARDADRDVERDRLVEQHVSLVHAVARKLKRQISARVEVDDLIGYGSKGLLEAAERFDPSHGVAFSTFAYYRIRGAMLDGVRTMGWYSRADYARYRAEERANEYLRNQADRDGAAAASTMREGAGAPPASDEKEATLAGIAEILSSIATVHITSLEAAATVVDDSLPAPDATLDTGRMGLRIRAAVKTLPERERQLMELYYFADKNLEEAGAVMGLSKSWACRLHARAVGLLRAQLADTIDE